MRSYSVAVCVEAALEHGVPAVHQVDLRAGQVPAEREDESAPPPQPTGPEVVGTVMYIRVGTTPARRLVMVSRVSVRDFSYNPSAMFARAEKGETIEITRHGKVIATLIPGAQKKRSRIEELVASGALRLSEKTLADLDTFTRIKLPEGAPDPLQLLLEERYSESDWEREFREEMEARRDATGDAKP
jgi:antitoxin (DNA-binding transcriptional repressor) of toxin-antitoxin stability system